MSKSLSELVKKDTYTKLNWEGTFDDYLQIVEQKPQVTRNAHRRLIDLIESYDKEFVDLGGERVAHYNIFDDPDFGGEDAIFGMDKPLEKLVEIIRGGANNWEVDKRLILLFGPVGTAKSTVARILKKYTEKYSQSEEGALYSFSFVPGLQDLDIDHFDWDAIERKEDIKLQGDREKVEYLEQKIPWILGSEDRVPNPLIEEPLKLIPAEARREFLTDLNKGKKGKDKVTVRGELNPQSRFMFKALTELYGGDWSKVIKYHVVIERVVLSEIDKVGITTFEPGDPKNQDSTDLTGDVNWINVPKYGSDADPRAFSYDGEFHKANRGILEFVEVLKLEPEFLYTLLGATAERKVKPKKQPQTSIDLVPLGHTNPWEMERMIQNKGMEAFRDRIIRVDVPYLLKLSDEIRIYEKSFNEDTVTDVHLAPHTLELAALWAVISRYTEPKDPRLNLIKKAKILDGQNVPGVGKDAIVNLLREGGHTEGMTGISPRMIQNVLAKLLARDQERGTTEFPDGCVSPFNLIPALEDELYTSNLVTEEEGEYYTNLLLAVRQEYLTIIKDEVRKATVKDGKGVQKLFDNYMDHVYASLDEVDKLSTPGLQPDYEFMASVESRLTPLVAENQAPEWRRELMLLFNSLEGKGKVITYASNDRLRRGLELKLFDDMRDSIKLYELGKTPKSDETKAVVSDVRDTLKDAGYCDICTDNLLQEAGSLFNRGTGS